MKTWVEGTEYDAIFVYYGRERRVTVCLLLDNNLQVVARGVSLCSLRDQPYKKRGRDIAMGRATKVIKSTLQGKKFANGDINRPEASLVLLSSGLRSWDWLSKAQGKDDIYLPEREREVLEGYTRSRPSEKAS